MGQKRKSKFLYILLFLLPAFVCIGLCVGYIYYNISQYRSEESVTLEGIAKRTGLPPDWLSIRTYVYCDLLKPGTPLENAQRGLALIGEYRPPNENSPINGSFEQEIDFTDSSTQYNLSPLMVSYDENSRVIWAGAGEFNHGPESYCEIERAESQIPPTPAK
jgi:hypothetical protein